MLDRGKGRIVNLVGGGTGNSFPHGSGYASSPETVIKVAVAFTFPRRISSGTGRWMLPSVSASRMAVIVLTV